MKKFSLFLLIILIFWSCSDDNPSGPDPDDFDREAILVNWADNIILPSLQSFSTSNEDLKNAGCAFSENPNEQTLEDFREAWRDSYLAWQYVSVFQMIEDTQFQFRNNLNLYPTNVDGIEQNISEGEYNLELPSQRDRQGLPALDFLLNGLGETDSEILEFYTKGQQAESYKQYVVDLVNRMDDLTGEVLNFWETDYRDQFVNNSGSGANASLDMMVNNYIYYYEKQLRAGKIGIPAGVFSATPLPDRTEAYYSEGFSKELLMEALDVSQSFFNGRHFNSQQTGESLASYLDYLNTMKEGADLTQLINDQFDTAREQAEELNPDFAEQVDNNNTLMLATYDELQRNVVYMKVDMLQALNISVDYIDADGD